MFLITTKLKSTRKNSGTFEGKKFPPKKSLTVLHHAIHLLRTLSSYLLISTMSSFVFSAIPVVIVCKMKQDLFKQLFNFQH